MVLLRILLMSLSPNALIGSCINDKNDDCLVMDLAILEFTGLASWLKRNGTVDRILGLKRLTAHFALELSFLPPSVVSNATVDVKLIGSQYFLYYVLLSRIFPSYDKCSLVPDSLQAQY